MLRKIAQLQVLAIVPQETATGAARHDQDATATSAPVGFDHKVGMLLQQAGQLPQAGMSGDNRVDFRRRYADGTTQVPHLALAIDQRKEGTRVVVEDALGIAAVHTQDAQLPQALPTAQPAHALPP